MAAALEDTTVSYEDLAAIEREFDDVETEIIRQQATLSHPLYTRRQATVAAIPNFWPLVLEQAPPDIDQYIQPSDSALLLSSLTSLSVSRFELSFPSSPSAPRTGSGEPRSICVRFEFDENEHFSDTVLEKRFWYRRARDGWAGLVSEPVAISWKSKDKDLTGGLLDLVCAAYTPPSTSPSSSTPSTSATLTPEQKSLQKKIDNTGMGGLSFFAWFGFIGRRISAAENEAVLRDGVKGVEAEGAENEELGLDMELELEIFPDGEELALAFADDLWPGAIRYFTQAQEQDALSDADFESDDDGEGEGVEIEDLDVDELDEERPAKKPRK
ncbi:putative nucleosome assembly protein [Lachnellula suecica]|uniref:Putative nucleosome assembly protein n=1 Tax=Lachnellula suecica TaxID=602035 RepID=A0A8T9CCZ2_9HELO|nr:putative nucleosome assembly protein [Lachnellula suecica]